jgi:hypothetical protein
MDVRKKAIDLIKKFDVKYYYKLTKGHLPVSMHNSVIKECILNSIDEIITELSKVHYRTDVNDILEDWQKVKVIIEQDFDHLYQAVP